MGYQLYGLLVWIFLSNSCWSIVWTKKQKSIHPGRKDCCFCKPTLLVTILQAQTHHLNSFLLLQTNQSSPNSHDFPLWWEVQATSPIFRVLQRWNNVWMLLFSKPCRAGADPSMEMWMRILKISKICSAKGKLKMFRCQEKCLGGICFFFKDMQVCLRDLTIFFWPSFK